MAGHGQQPTVVWARELLGLSREHAEWYATAPGFGGPQLYRAEAEINDLLDLRRKPWALLAEQFGPDRDDYASGAPDHKLFADLVPVLAAARHDWAVFRLGDNDEWIRLAVKAI